MPDVLIFLTATIDCGQTPHVKRRDPELRRQDYLKAFRSWLSSDCKADILLCENSNSDLSDFSELAGTRTLDHSVRLMTFAGNSGAQLKGKGYGEIEMLRHAFDKFPELMKYRYIIKVTGRYQILNAAKIVGRIRRMKQDLICDIHNNLTYGDSFLFAFKPEVALKHLVPYKEDLDELSGVIIEHLVAKCLHLTLAAGGSWAPLPCSLVVNGISGSWNTPQRVTSLELAKRSIKRTLATWVYRY
jgi:hypothetical protein